MKKLSLIICLIILATFFVSCAPSATEKVSIEFKIDGVVYVTEYVEKGEDFTDFPTVKLRKGYQVVWDRNSLSNINENVVIIGSEVQDEYTINLDTNGGKLKGTSIKVTYGGEYLLGTPKKDGYYFDGWYKGNVKVDDKGVWLEENGATFTAKWVEGYTLTFKVQGQEDVVVNVNKDQIIDQANIPELPELIGYEDPRWSVVDYSELVNVNSEIVAIYKPKLYTIYCDLGYSGAKVIEQKVAYAAEVTPTALPQPTREGFEFVGWVYKSTQQEVTTFNYLIDGDLQLKALWRQI